MAASTGSSAARRWMLCGGGETRDSYNELCGGIAELRDIPKSHWKFLQSRLLPFLETESFVFVHGSVDPKLPIESQSEAGLLWKGFSSMSSRHCSGKAVICGHEMQESGWPVQSAFGVCIDTGAWYDGWLTCYEPAAGRYPARCVRCGDENEGRTVWLWTHKIGWWTIVFWIFGWGFTTRAPACATCGWRIRAQRFGGLLVTVVAAGLFLTFLWPHVGDFVTRSFRKWVALGLVIVCLLPYILWETFFPPAIDITAYKDSVDYEFKDAEFALEFAELNEDAEWVRIN